MASAPSLSRTKRTVFFTLPFLVFGFVLAAIEGVVRSRYPRLDSLDVFVRSPQLQDDFEDRQHVRIFEGDPLLYWRLKPNLDRAIWDFTVVSTNAQRLRHPRPLGRKRGGAWRAVCLGDSVTFGFRVPVVFPKRPKDYAPDWLPYPMLLDDSLRAANPKREIDVVAMAVPGYTSYQGLAWLRRDIGWLEPDVITVCFGWNDISTRAASDRATMATDWRSTLGRGLIARSQALLHLAQLRRGQQESAAVAAPAAPVCRVERDDYVAHILEMARIARAHDAALIVIGPVYRDRVTSPAEASRIGSYRDALRHAAGQARVPYLEIPELTEHSPEDNSGLFGELIHPNHLGHRLMASRVLRFLADHGTLGDLAVPTLRGE